MIYSSVNENWQRVVIMNSVAKGYFRLTANSDFRTRMTTQGSDVFPFDVGAYTEMEKESCIVGMLMAWSVVALESIINHLLAERINNKMLATRAIEYPSQVIEKMKLKTKSKSDLSKRMIILADKMDNIDNAVSLADELVDIRNYVVHDKPFDHIDHGDGEVSIVPFRIRGCNSRTFHYHEIGEFYEKCDCIVEYLANCGVNSTINFSELKFFPLFTCD